MTLVSTSPLNQSASGAVSWLFSMHASAKSLEATSQFILMATVDEYAAKRHIDINRYDRARMGELPRAPAGLLNFRFILQPTIAAILALRAGINDARNGRPAYLWAAFTKPAYRAQLLHGGWKDIRTPFLVSAVLDAIYQLITHRFIYPLELLFTATLLALVPYLISARPGE